MSKVTAISGKKGKQCQYCGVVPESEHPGYSCPRIASFAWAEGELSVEYVDLSEWTQFLELLRARKANDGTSDEAT